MGFRQILTHIKRVTRESLLDNLSWPEAVLTIGRYMYIHVRSQS